MLRRIVCGAGDWSRFSHVLCKHFTLLPRICSPIKFFFNLGALFVLQGFGRIWEFLDKCSRIHPQPSYSGLFFWGKFSFNHFIHSWVFRLSISSSLILGRVYISSNWAINLCCPVLWFCFLWPFALGMVPITIPCFTLILFIWIFWFFLVNITKVVSFVFLFKNYSYNT